MKLIFICNESKKILYIYPEELDLIKVNYMYKYLSIMMVLLLVSSHVSASQREKFTSKKKGMAKAEVEKIMGKPEKICKTSLGDLQYTFPKLPSTKKIPEGKNKYWIVFDKHILSSFCA